MHQVSKVQPLREGIQLPAEEMTEAQKKLLVWEGDGFDLRTHIIDARSGQLLKYQPYRRTVSAAEGTFYFRKDDKGHERKYLENGLPAETPQVAAKK